MPDIPALPNEILVQILKSAGPATATTARRVCKLFNGLVVKHGLGKHCCEDLVIKSQNSLFSVILKRITADGILRQMTFEVEFPFFDQLFIFITEKFIHSLENLNIVGCLVDIIFLKLMSHLCSLLKRVDALQNRTCSYHCTAAEFGCFIQEQKFSRFDCNFGTENSTHLVITDETFANYMPSTVVILLTSTLLTDEFLEILALKKPKTFHLEDSSHQITFDGLNKFIKGINILPECSWSFGLISTTPAESFIEFMELLQKRGFEQTKLNRGNLHFQVNKGKFSLSFHTGNLRVL